MAKSFPKPQLITKREYLELQEFFSIELKLFKKDVGRMLNKSLIGCYSNHVTSQGRFYPKIYYIIWELYTEKNAKKPTAHLSIISVDNRKIMKLRKITTY